MLDKCSFLKLTSGMLYKTFLNMLAAALDVMKSWKLEVLRSLCGRLRTGFSMLPSFSMYFRRNHFSWFIFFLGHSSTCLQFSQSGKLSWYSEVLFLFFFFFGLHIIPHAYIPLYHIKSFFLKQRVHSLQKTNNFYSRNACVGWNPIPTAASSKIPTNLSGLDLRVVFILLLYDTLVNP